MALGPLLAAQLFGGLFGGVLRFTAAQIGLKLAIPMIRTAGFFYNRFLGALGLSARERLLIGVTLGFPAGINPFLFAFMSGAAYENEQQLVDAWLSTFGEILFKDFPGVEGEIEKGAKALGRGDFRDLFDAWAEAFSEEAGLEDMAAFFRGLSLAASDFLDITGIALPLNWLGEATIWADRALRGFFDPFPRPSKPPAPIPFRDLPLDPGLRRGFDPKTQRKLPDAIRRLTMKILTPRDQRRAVLFDIGEKVSQGVKDKLRRLVLGRPG